MNSKVRTILIARYKKEKIQEISLSNCLDFLKRTLGDLVIILAIGILLFIIIFFWSLFDPKLNWQLTNSSEGVQGEPAIAKGTPYKESEIIQINSKKIEEYLVKIRLFHNNKRLNKLMVTGTAVLNKISRAKRISYISIPNDNFRIGVTNQTSPNFLANYVIQQKYFNTNIYFYDVFSETSPKLVQKSFNTKFQKWKRKRIYIKQNKKVLSYTILNDFKSSNIDKIRTIISKRKSREEVVFVGIYSTNKPNFKITILQIEKEFPSYKQRFSMFNQF